MYEVGDGSDGCSALVLLLLLLLLLTGPLLVRMGDHC